MSSLCHCRRCPSGVYRRLALHAPVQQGPALPAPVRQGPVGDSLTAFIIAPPYTRPCSRVPPYPRPCGRAPSVTHYRRLSSPALPAPVQQGPVSVGDSPPVFIGAPPYTRPQCRPPRRTMASMGVMAQMFCDAGDSGTQFTSATPPHPGLDGGFAPLEASLRRVAGVSRP